MATINDIGVPGQPLSTPPLTAWQAAVRDRFNTPIQGAYVRPSDLVGTAGAAMVCGTLTVAGATGRMVLITAEFITDSSVTANWTFYLKCGATAVRFLTVNGIAAGGSRLYSLTGLGLAGSDTFTTEAVGSAGAVALRTGSGFTVTTI